MSLKVKSVPTMHARGPRKNRGTGGWIHTVKLGFFVALSFVRFVGESMLDPAAQPTSLGQNGKGTGLDAPNSSSADGEPPAKRQNLTRTGTGTERGKPAGLPEWESEPQGTLMGLRVWDGGKSECLPVIGRIGVEPVAEVREPRRQAT